MKIYSRQNSFEVRTITQCDIEDILELYRQCEDFLALGPESHASSGMVLQDIESVHNKGGVFQGIFESDGNLVGVCSYITSGYECSAEIAFIVLLMTTPRFRNQGLGTDIIRFVEREIQKNSEVKAILSAVQVNNPKGIRFWQKNGYIIVSEPELQTDNTTVFRLRKEFISMNRVG